MSDTRLETFLTLCEVMNYRKTAEILNMTQPAVTQHIHHLEEDYGCRLFTYNGRTLRRTDEAEALERYARSAMYNEAAFREQLKSPSPMSLSIGATKTIGDYVIGDKVSALLKRDDISLNLIIDNTEHLLSMLNSALLDVLMVEGVVDKNCYGHELMRNEELIGICAANHSFAGREVALSEIFSQHIILREEGSGTKAVFERFLEEKGYSPKSFRKASNISSFKLIEKAVSEGCGISFVYKSVYEGSSGLGLFRIRGERIFHEFNFIFLKDTDHEKHLSLLRDGASV